MKKSEQLKIVCLGGGVGTVQLLRGLREYSQKITVACSMADDGGSGGRLRRLYSIPPPGDLINCLAALSEAEPILKELLTYRFGGDRYSSDSSLAGQKLGNLILVALTQITGDFNRALREAERIFSSHGIILPATVENVSISAQTMDGQIIRGEQKIDRGEYNCNQLNKRAKRPQYNCNQLNKPKAKHNGLRALKRVYLQPKSTHTPPAVKQALQKADLIIAGPGDLYTTILPVLLVEEIKEGIVKSQAVKIFVVNVANKPFETPNYLVSDYLLALKRHLGSVPFNFILVNKNFKPPLPQDLAYQYVKMDPKMVLEDGFKVLQADLVERKFPLYHDPQKLARAVLGVVKSTL